MTSARNETVSVTIIRINLHVDDCGDNVVRNVILCCTSTGSLQQVIEFEFLSLKEYSQNETQLKEEYLTEYIMDMHWNFHIHVGDCVRNSICHHSDIHNRSDQRCYYGLSHPRVKLLTFHVTLPTNLQNCVPFVITRHSTALCILTRG